MTPETPWEAGRFDARRGRQRVLFGRMYEDPAVEQAAFTPGGRVFCIASAGCTARALSQEHDVVACDINRAQLEYCARRIAGEPIEIGSAEKVMGFGRALMPLAGWSVDAVREFLAMNLPGEQIAFWKEYLDTWLFRTGFDAMLSLTGLRAIYSPRFLSFLPPRFGAVLRGRMARCFARHPNAQNPYARALLLGDADTTARSHPAARIELVHSDAASYLEGCVPGSFAGFTLSNILDGAAPAYRERLFAAVRRASAPGAVAVLRSFGEPHGTSTTNHAEGDRSMLWGIVDVRPTAAL
jgi:S-adenosylmethionine:diacylglycerol 3-amino-3-carboxypropyl transferase